MAKHYLNPQQTEGPQDVETWHDGCRWHVLCAFSGTHFPDCCASDPGYALGHGHATEDEALAAARKATGYATPDRMEGHLAPRETEE